jgi:hypothetical protein
VIKIGEHYKVRGALAACPEKAPALLSAPVEMLVAAMSSAKIATTELSPGRASARCACGRLTACRTPLAVMA